MKMTEDSRTNVHDNLTGQSQWIGCTVLRRVGEPEWPDRVDLRSLVASHSLLSYSTASRRQ